ncbi:MAG: methyl-accepting chemotaxis protein [Candidatus Omnitrophota bacterium]|jgi:methyl-accepting chemotaxis protein
MKMTVRIKLLGGFCIVLSLMLIMGLVTYTMFAKAGVVTADVDKSTELNTFFVEKEVDHLKWVAKLSDQFLLGKLFDGELDYHNCGLGKWYYSFGIDKIKSPELKRLFKELEDPHQKLHGTGKRIKELYAQGDVVGAKDIYAKETKKYAAEVQDLLTQMRKIFSNKVEADKGFLFTQMGTTKITIVVILFIGIILGVTIALLVARGITNPLQILGRLLRKMAAGDLLQEEIKVFSKDELGDLAQTFSVMNRGLAEMVVKVLSSANKVSSASQEMSSSSQEMNASSQEISNAIMQVNKGVTIQAENVAETAKIMERSAVSLKQMVASAQTANQTIDNTSARLERGMIVVQEATKKIEQLSETVLETTKVVQGLGESSKKIGDITETITSIADQTNLLALNAAIEAARAGEAGRGFAVVAEEVRKLAEGSAEAVRKIGTLIKSIQAETENAVKAIQKSSSQAGEGKAQISDINGILVEVNKMAGESSNLAKEVVSGGQERVIEIERVLKAIKDISNIAQESASATEEITSSTEEQTASMQQLSASAQELARLAMDLQELVSKFKV